MLLEAACTDSTVFMGSCGVRAAFVWLCKPETIENHELYHATVVSRCTSKAMNLPAAVLREVLWVTALLPKLYRILCLYSRTCSKSMDQPGMVANPARGQLNIENYFFPVRVRA